MIKQYITFREFNYRLGEMRMDMLEYCAYAPVRTIENPWKFAYYKLLKKRYFNFYKHRITHGKKQQDSN
jgi:hypothetical protein